MKERKNERKVMIYIFIVSIISLLIASYIEFNKAFSVDSCFKEMGGCAIVDASAFSDFGGLPVSIIGILGFLLLTLVSFIQIKKPNEKRGKIIFLLVAAMSIFSLYLIFAQFFIINAVCRYCLIVDFLTLSMFAALFLR